MRDTTNDDVISGHRNTYGFERGDILRRKRSLNSDKFVDTVEVLRTWKYTVLVRSCITGKEFKEYNWFFSPAS